MPSDGVLRKGLFLLFVLLGAFVFYSRLVFIFQYSFPVSWDSFFYLLGLKHYISTSELYYRLHGIFIAFWGHVAILAKLNEVQTYYLVVCASLLLFGLSLVGLGLIFDLGVFAWLLPVIAWSSNLIFLQAYNFISEFFSFSLALTGAVFLLAKFPDQRTESAARFLGTLGVVLATTLHVFTSLVCCCLILPVASYRMGRLSRRHWGVFIVLVLICVGHFYSNPKPVFFNFNFQKINSSSFVLLRSYFIAFQYREFFFSAAVVLSMGALLFFKGEGSRLFWALFAGFGILVSPLWISFWSNSHHPGSLSDRLPQTALLLFPVLLAVAAPFKTSIWNRGLRNLILFATAVFLFSQRYYFHLKDHHLGPRMQVALLSDNVVFLKRWIPPSAIVKAEHGIQYRVTYFLGNASFQRIQNLQENDVYFTIENRPLNSCPEINSQVLRANQTVDCVSLGQNWIVRREHFHRQSIST